MFETPWLFQMHLFALCIGSVEEVSPLLFWINMMQLLYFLRQFFQICSLMPNCSHPTAHPCHRWRAAWPSVVY